MSYPEDTDYEPGLAGRDPGVAEVLPGLARVAAEAWLRTAAWGVEASLRIGTRVAQAAVSQDAAYALVEDVRSGLRSYARELLGISDLDQRVAQLMPSEDGSLGYRSSDPDVSGRVPRALRRAGAELLRKSADPSIDDDTHPAFARVLAELHPDEARILRLLMVEGAQPSLDVRSASLIGAGSQLVAHGLNMLGAEAGVRHVDRVPVYLNNLHRLGLTRFTEDPIDIPSRYQVLEAQPATMQAIKRAGRAKTIHRSIVLTEFGQDFCEVCLPLQESEVEALAPDD